MKIINPKERAGGTAFVEEVRSAIIEKGKVKITGLGIFEVRKMKGGRRALFGKVQTIGAYNKLTFRPTLLLKKKIHG